MGMTDFEVVSNYSSVVSEMLNELHVGAKVAWLGQKHPSTNEDKFIFDSIMSGVNNDLVHDFYDLNNSQFDNSIKWNVHDEWDIKDYDLVLGLRVLYLCDSVEKLLRNLKKISASNKMVVFDFMTGNPTRVDDIEVFSKSNDSKTILPFFPEFYKGKYSVKQNHEDQVITLDKIEGSGMVIKNILTFRDSVKNRFYTLCEVRSES
tara:strand:- start:1566 stop:2180 length:615 start_codon:yes stop_codon:yes gene_type:complete